MSQAAPAAQTLSQALRLVSPSPLFSELIEKYKRDRLAAKRWTPKTQDENLAVYKLCMDIIGDLPISEIGEDEALTYFETMQKLPANMNKMPACRRPRSGDLCASLKRWRLRTIEPLLALVARSTRPYRSRQL